MEAQADWVTREELRAAQAQDRKEIQELAKQVAKLEGQVGESDKRLATKADVEKAIGAVRSDIRLLRYGLSIGLLLLIALFGDLTLSDVLRLLLRLGGG